MRIVRCGMHFVVLALVVCPIVTSATGASVEWPTFRGSERTAVSDETDLLQEWPAGGPPLLWTAKGAGRGYSSLAIKDGRLFALGDGIAGVADADEYLFCHDLTDGTRLWATRMGAPWTDGQPTWQSSRSTPTVDDECVYALSANGELVCCDAASGQKRWRKNLKSTFGGTKADSWGYSESVLIDGDRLICTPGGTQATMAALDKRTGETIWTTVREGDVGAGHASIVISEIGGVRVYVQTTGSGALGVRAADGELLWSYPMERTTAVAPTPIIRGDLVFIAAGYKRGGALLRQTADGSGKVAVDEIYPFKPQLANKHGGIVLIGDHLFGDSDDSGILYCADLLTGEITWKARSEGKGSIAVAAADGCLYLHYANGTMVLAKADPEKHVETGLFTVPHSGERPSWAHPVILDGKLYLREHDAILCYGIREDVAASTSDSAE
ncbi:MAG: PQQ-like beta-propeller repeat protein [Planctomycetaceae bacterium]|nr:PQQ-like beta-propeller repeat protein [Planctomycetaceae bacterium]